jgi:hypothetical protein
MQCSLRSLYSTTQTPDASSYSHLERTVFHPRIKENPGGWRDTPEEYAHIGRTVDDISKYASMSLSSHFKSSNSISPTCPV